jgi:hypothetical protein
VDIAPAGSPLHESRKAAGALGIRGLPSVRADPGDRTGRQSLAVDGALNLRVPSKPFPQGREVGLKRIPAITAPIKQRGSIMLAIILNSIYRQFLRSSLSGMRKFAAG